MAAPSHLFRPFAATRGQPVANIETDGDARAMTPSLVLLLAVSLRMATFLALLAGCILLNGLAAKRAR